MASKNKHFNSCNPFGFPLICPPPPIQEQPQSAFRAVNTSVEQSVTVDVPVIPVLYPNKIFDLNNEYNPITSTFTPKQDGVYLIIASVNFFPDIVTNYRVLVLIRVNDVPVASDNDFFGEIPIGDVTSVSAILPLKAGDTVNVAAASSTDGTILSTAFAFPTHFEAARFPSPNGLHFLSTNNISTSTSTSI
ncbi:C1q-like domain-containing protein [Bacillus sp. TD10]|uniref:C1q-like domain-containing protein n=1 Tax=Bacillus TaxID=1386 RepID=UPI0030150757